MQTHSDFSNQITLSGESTSYLDNFVYGVEHKLIDTLLRSCTEQNIKKELMECKEFVKIVALGILNGEFEDQSYFLDIRVARQCLKYSIKYYPSQTKSYLKSVKSLLETFPEGIQSAMQYTRIAKIVKKHDKKLAFLFAGKAIKKIASILDTREARPVVYRAISVLGEVDIQAAYEFTQSLEDENPVKILGLCKVIKMNDGKTDLGNKCFEQIKNLIAKLPSNPGPYFCKIFSVIKYITVENTFKGSYFLMYRSGEFCERADLSALCELYKNFGAGESFVYQEKAVEMLEIIKNLYQSSVNGMNKYCFCFDGERQSEDSQLKFSCYPFTTNLECKDEQLAYHAQNAILIGHKIRHIQPILAGKYFDKAYKHIDQISFGIDHVRLMCRLFKQAKGVWTVSKDVRYEMLLYKVTKGDKVREKIQQLSMLFCVKRTVRGKIFSKGI